MNTRKPGLFNSDNWFPLLCVLLASAALCGWAIYLGVK